MATFFIMILFILLRPMQIRCRWISTLHQQPFSPSYPSPPPIAFSAVPSLNFSSSFITVTTTETKHTASQTSIPIIIVSVLILSSILITAAAIFLYSRRWRRRQNHHGASSGNNGGVDFHVVHPLPPLPRNQNIGDIELSYAGGEEESVASHEVPSPPQVPLSPSIILFLGKRKSSSTLSPISSPERRIKRRLYNQTIDQSPLKSETLETPQPKLKLSSQPADEASTSSRSTTLNVENFVANTTNSIGPSPNQVNGILDPKKYGGIANLLRVYTVTGEEVRAALLNGNANALEIEIFEILFKFAPTKDEERKLKLCRDDSPVKLGPAERFLKAILDVPFALKRVEVLLFIDKFNSLVEFLMNSSETVKAACEELRSSSTFLNLLEAVINAGSLITIRANHGYANAHKLEALLKFINIKGADRRVTLLHLAIQEIVSHLRSFQSLNIDGRSRKLDLQAVSALNFELPNVKKAAAMDSNVISSYFSELFSGIQKVEDAKRWNDATWPEKRSQNFSDSMNGFMQKAEEEITRIKIQQGDAFSLVKETIEHFNGNPAKGPFRIFTVVRDFLEILDQACKKI